MYDILDGASAEQVSRMVRGLQPEQGDILPMN